MQIILNIVSSGTEFSKPHQKKVTFLGKATKGVCIHVGKVKSRVSFSVVIWQDSDVKILSLRVKYFINYKPATDDFYSYLLEN